MEDEEDRDIIKVVPREEELQSREPGQMTRCDVAGCGSLFKSWPQLAFHKAKTHGIDKGQLSSPWRKQPGKQYHFHCPVASCHYNANSPRHFTDLKLLRQHFLLCHAEARYRCDKCGRGFALACHWRRHETTCGQVFTCPTCTCPYTTLEALRTHCLRRQHPLPPQYARPPRPPKKETKRNVVPRSEGGDLGPCFVVFQVKDKPGTGNAALPPPSASNLRPILPKWTPAPVVPLYKSAFPTREATLPGVISRQSSQDGMGSALLGGRASQSLADLPGISQQTSTGTQVVMATQQDVGLQQSAEMSSTGMQTALSFLPNTECLLSSVGTQISGSDILQSAMKSADIPTPGREAGTGVPADSQTQRRHCSIQAQRDCLPPPRKRHYAGRSQKSAEQTMEDAGSTESNWPTHSVEENLFDLMSHIATQTPMHSSADAAVGSSEPMRNVTQSVESQTNLLDPGSVWILPESVGILQGTPSQTDLSCLRDGAMSVDANIQTAETLMQSQTQTHLSCLGSRAAILVDAELQTVPMESAALPGMQDGITMTESDLLSCDAVLDADTFFERGYSLTDSSAQTLQYLPVAENDFLGVDLPTVDASFLGNNGASGGRMDQMAAVPNPGTSAISVRTSSSADTVLQDAATSPGAAVSDLQSSETQTWLSAFRGRRDSALVLEESTDLGLASGRLSTGMGDGMDRGSSPCFSVMTGAEEEDFIADFLDQSLSSLPEGRRVPSCGNLSGSVCSSALTSVTDPMTRNATAGNGGGTMEASKMQTSSPASLAAEVETQTPAARNVAQTQTWQTATTENDTQTLFSARQVQTQTDSGDPVTSALQSQMTQTAVLSNEAETQTAPRSAQNLLARMPMAVRKLSTNSSEASTGLDWLEGIEAQTQTVVSVAMATDTHTQTASDLLDFLMTNMRTQAGKDPCLPTPRLSDIQTRAASKSSAEARNASTSPEMGSAPFLAAFDFSEAETQTYGPGTTGTDVESQTKTSAMMGTSMPTQTMKLNTGRVRMKTQTRDCGFGGVSMETQTRSGGFDGISMETQTRSGGFGGVFMETQTRDSGFIGVSMETQTASSLILENPCDQVFLADTETQTQLQFDLDDLAVMDSHTQTSAGERGASELASASCQTLISLPMLDFDDVGLTDSHTQTSLLALAGEGNGRVAKSDAQTSADFLDLMDVPAVDSQTRNGARERFRSAELRCADAPLMDSHTQTMAWYVGAGQSSGNAASSSRRPPAALGDASLISSQTQTTLMLPDFDDPNLTDSYTQTNVDNLDKYWNMD